MFGFRKLYQQLASPKNELERVASSGSNLLVQIKAIDVQINHLTDQIQAHEEKMKKQVSPDIQKEYELLIQTRQDLLNDRKPLADALSAAAAEISGLRREVYGEPGNQNERRSTDSNQLKAIQ